MSKHSEFSIIDWELGVQLAGKLETAKELLTLLSKNLPEEIAMLKKNQHHSTALLKGVHKLHGALCYCGTPRLKKAAAQLESALKKKDDKMIPKLFKCLEKEAALLLEKLASTR